MKRFLLCAAMALAASAQLRTRHHKPENDDVFRPLLEIDAVVTDAQGQPVTGLSPSDFELRYDQKPQAISGFAYVNAHPSANAPGGAYESSGNFPQPPIVLKPDQIRRTLVLVVDDLSLTETGIARVRGALEKFIGSQMQPGDAAAIFRTSRDRQDCPHSITSDKRALLQAAACLTYDYGRPPSPSAAAAGAAVALRPILSDVQETPGRKAVVLLSSGAESPVLRTLRTDFDIVRGVFYPVQVEGTPRPANHPNAAWLAQATGGFALADAALNDALARVLKDQQGYYLLSYRAQGDSVFQVEEPKIDLTLKRAGLQLRRREAPTETPMAQTSVPAEDLGGWAARSGRDAGLNPIPLHLTALFSDSAARGPYADVLVHLDGKALVCTRDLSGTWHANFDIGAAALAAEADRSRVSQASIHESWNDADHRKMLEQGLDELLEVPLPNPGGYQVIASVRDQTGGAFGRDWQFVDAPDLRKGLAMSGIVLRRGDERTLQELSNPNSAQRSGGIAIDRQFHEEDSVVYTYRVFNLTVDPQGGAKIETRVRVLRNGAVLYTGNPSILEFKRTNDPKHRAVAGVLKTGMQPGRYVLEILLKDLLAPKPAAVTGYIDFNVQ